MYCPQHYPCLQIIIRQQSHHRYRRTIVIIIVILITIIVIFNHNDNYSDSSINYHTTSTISSPQSHHLHHQGYGGASSTNSSHSINYTEECVESILALPPLPIFYKVPGLNNNEMGYLKNNLPPTYMPVYFASTTTLSTLHSWHGDMILSYPSQVLH